MKAHSANFVCSRVDDAARRLQFSTDDLTRQDMSGIAQRESGVTGRKKFLGDIFGRGRTENTAYYMLFSLWTDKYDVQTLFSVHSGCKLIPTGGYFRQRLNNIHQRATTICTLENTQNNVHLNNKVQPRDWG